jgi:hypothetical protein
MDTKVETTVSDLAHEIAIAAIPTPEETKKDAVSPCATKDTECMNRWISAFSDCA